MNKQWQENKIDKTVEDRANQISKKFDLDKLISIYLAKKELDDEQVKKFLFPNIKDLYDPFKMPDMEKAVKRIVQAINNKEKILIFGDYDVDGLTSTTILKKFFKTLGINVGVYIPNRLKEGYGLNKDSIKEIEEKNYKLIITVDCGISAIQEVDYINNLTDIDIIITDHHEPLEILPKAYAIVDCKRKDNNYPFRELAGCGVAFKLVQALCKKLNFEDEEFLKYIDLACVGTISDIVPLVDENRIIAKIGLERLKNTDNIGLRELIKISRIKEINSYSISFSIAPRINACGRLGYQYKALNLLLTDDLEIAKTLSVQIESLNRKRQDIEKRIYEEALAYIEKDEKEKNIIICGKENWHTGVLGIVSSKITDKYYKPSILICFEDEISRGSGRSLEGINLHEILSKNTKNLESFGGHSMAIGVAIKKEKFEDFKKEIIKYVEDNLKEEDFTKKIYIDFEVNKELISMKAIKELEKLEPFGCENEKPVILYKNLNIINIMALSEGKHLKLTLTNFSDKINGIGFNLGEFANKFKIRDKVDIIGNLEINNFNNTETIQINIKDLRKSKY